MRWVPGGSRADIEDRRSSGGGFGGGGMKLGLGGILFLGLMSVIFKQDFLSMVSGPPSRTHPGCLPTAMPASGGMSSSSRSSSTMHSRRGTNCWRNLALLTVMPNSCCSAISRSRAAAPRKRLRVRSIARPTRRRTSISGSSKSCRELGRAG